MHEIDLQRGYSIYLFIYLFIYLIIHSFIHLFIYLLIYLLKTSTFRIFKPPQKLGTGD